MVPLNLGTSMHHSHLCQYPYPTLSHNSASPDVPILRSEFPEHCSPRVSFMLITLLTLSIHLSICSPTSPLYIPDLMSYISFIHLSLYLFTRSLLSFLVTYLVLHAHLIHSSTWCTCLMACLIASSLHPHVLIPTCTNYPTLVFKPLLYILYTILKINVIPWFPAWSDVTSVLCAMTSPWSSLYLLAPTSRCSSRELPELGSRPFVQSLPTTPTHT